MDLYTEIINKINDNHKPFMRKAKISDFTDEESNDTIENLSRYEQYKIPYDKQMRYRMQGEHGEKKYIKP